MDEAIHIYTDGSSRGNPGPGGWGAILMYKEQKREIFGSFRYTTNNRMELMAVIEALKLLKKKEDYEIIIYSDSKYVVDSYVKKWVFNWQKNNFKDRLNADLWKEFLQLVNSKVKMKWVKGHASNEFNNKCDILATEASSNANKNKWLIDKIYEKIKNKPNSLFGHGSDFGC